MTLAKRSIDLTFQLGVGAFGEDGQNTVDLSGLRCSANVTKTGGVSMSRLELTVYGMPLEAMNKLTVLNQLARGSARLNQVAVSAGDTKRGMAVVFTGGISEAWVDVEDVGAVFRVTAMTGLLDSLRPIKPTSFNGTVDVATAMAGIAAQMAPPRTLENSGVNVQVRDVYKPGTALDQIRSLAREANINAVLDDPNILAIWPADSARGSFATTDIGTPDGSLVPIVSAATGMVGYPKFTQNSILFKTLYDPSMVFGRKVEVQSVLEPANGIWTIGQLTHNLDSEIPGGAWFTSVEAGRLGNPLPISSPG